MKIKLYDIAEMGACDTQRRKFNRLFPRGATINARNLDKAHKAGLNVPWLTRRLPKTEKIAWEIYHVECAIRSDSYSLPRRQALPIYRESVERHYQFCRTLLLKHYGGK